MSLNERRETEKTSISALVAQLYSIENTIKSITVRPAVMGVALHLVKALRELLTGVYLEEITKPEP